MTSATLAIALCVSTAASGEGPISAAPEWHCGVGEQSPASVTLKVTAGEFDRVDTPVVFELPGSLAQWKHFRMTRVDDRAEVAVQRIDGSPSRIAWLIRKPIGAGQSRQYILTPCEEAAESGKGVTCSNNGKQLSLSIGEKSVLRYNHAAQSPPEGLDDCFRRSGYVHPLFSPSGRQVTGDFPPDHAHQHAVFFPWVNTTFQGRSVDFWNQKKATGKIEHVDIRQTVSGPVFGEFTVVLQHSDLTAPDGPIPVLNESWTVRAYNLDEFFLVDIQSHQRCASADPLTINEYHYGGMAIRGSHEWFDSDVAATVQKLLKTGADAEELARVSVKRDYLTSEGKTWVDGNGDRARWVEMHGQIDGQPAGVAILCHPTNFRAPQPVRLHPHKPYFCFAPMALGAFQIPPGTTYTSRYRYYVHDGPADAKSTERIWCDYVEPPVVEVIQEDEKP